MSIGIVILVGGRSTRMGADKWSLILWNKTFLEILLSELAPLRLPTALVHHTNQSPADFAAKLVDPKLLAECMLLADREDAAGPLHGLEIGLEWSVANQLAGCLLLACDTPAVSRGFVQGMISAFDQANVEALVPRFDDRLQPMLSIYRTASLATLKANRQAGKQSMHGLLDSLSIEVVDPTVWEPNLVNLRGVNTPADYQELRVRIEKSESV